MERTKKVAILGGNFNPVHYGHLMIADQVAQKLGFDQVYLMPEYLPPHVDEKKTIAAENRLAMLKLAVENNPRLVIEDLELKRQGVSYTLDSIRELRRLHPDTDYYFIIGNDMVDYLPKWHEIDELCKILHFIAVKREEGASKESPYPVEWLDLPIIDISSSEIRQMIASGVEPTYLLPEKVIEYIKSHHLYS